MRRPQRHSGYWNVRSWPRPVPSVIGVKPLPRLLRAKAAAHCSQASLNDAPFAPITTIPATKFSFSRFATAVLSLDRRLSLGASHLEANLYLAPRESLLAIIPSINLCFDIFGATRVPECMVASRQKTRLELWAPIETALAAGMAAFRSVRDRFSISPDGGAIPKKTVDRACSRTRRDISEQARPHFHGLRGTRVVTRLACRSSWSSDIAVADKKRHASVGRGSRFCRCDKWTRVQAHPAGFD
jgi:hypothetical protein